MQTGFIYKIADVAEWAQAKAGPGWIGSKDDQRDGFIHFSTAAQLQATLARHFAGKERLILARFKAAWFGAALRFEPSRGNDHFPHLYARLDPASADREAEIVLGPDGRHLLPDWADE